jgi:signal transduction histidine kinase
MKASDFGEPGKILSKNKPGPHLIFSEKARTWRLRRPSTNGRSRQETKSNMTQVLLFSTQRKTNGLFLLAIGVMVLITFANLAHFRRFQKSTRDVIHTQNTLRGLANLHSAIQDAETGQRGFLLTGNPTYLRPFQQGRIECDRFFDYVQRLTINDLTQQAALGRLKILFREKFNELELTIHLKSHQEDSKVQAILHSNIGRDLMEEVRGEINAMEAREEMDFKQNQEVLAAQTNQRIWMLLIGTTISVGLLLWMLYLLKQEIAVRRQSQNALESSKQQLQNQATELIASNQELEAFCYSVSHDLRAPLRGIGGFSQLVSEKYRDVLGEEGRGYLDRVHKGIHRMSQLIDDLLNLSRITRVAMTVKPVDLASLSREVVQDFRDPTKAERTVEWIIPPSLQTLGDPQLLRTVLENLIGNALKFTAKRDNVRIEVGQETHPDGPVYFIRDNGAGFDMAYQDKLFHAFQRLHTTAEFPGTGIGLATVQRIVKRHNGRIWAESKIDEGATFFFTLRRSHAN